MAVEELAKPYNFLHRQGGPKDTGGPRFTIYAWSKGVVQFTPKGSLAPVVRPVTRIWIRRLDKPSPAPYYDLSSQVLQAQLAGYLETNNFAGRVFSIRVSGRKPMKQFGLNVEVAPDA